MFSQVEMPPRERGITWSRLARCAAASAAVLAGVAVAGENVEARKTHVALGDTLVCGQQKHARYADKSADDAKALVMHVDREVAPRIEIEGAVLVVNRPGDALVEQRKGALYRGHMNRQVRAVQHQNLAVKNPLPPDRDRKCRPRRTFITLVLARG